MRRATLFRQNYDCFEWIFLSTLSLRRATTRESTGIKPIFYFYPRSPCGERHTWARGSRVTYVISIHALLAESDARRASRQQPAGISIHALLAESDIIRQHSEPDGGNFYPRSPCGERPTDMAKRLIELRFLSTLSLRRATPIIQEITVLTVAFLSTLSLRRATANSQPGRQARHDFYPRSPCGERLHLFASSGVDFAISIHALLAESDANLLKNQHQRKHFYPRSPCGERL